MSEVPARSKRGRETAGDMVRSLGLILVVVVVVFFFAQPPGSDSAGVREVSPAGDISAFRADVPQAAVPGALPSGWRPTVTQLTGQPASLRVGWNTPSNGYAEYAATTAPADDVVQELTGSGRQLDPVDVAGTAWQQYVDGDGSLSLVRAYGPATVVVGTRRATAPLSELVALAGSLTVG